MTIDLTTTQYDRVRTITLNRPHRANALSPALVEQLGDAMLEAADDGDVRVIIVTGEGSRAFCAGADIKESLESGRPMARPMAGARRNLHEIVLETWKPTIAALNGAAVAGGCELALACDMRIMADHAVFALPEAKRGMGAHFASVMLARHLPPAIAFDMLYRGRSMAAGEALRWGLVNEVVTAADLSGRAATIAAEIARNAPVSLRRMKETVIKASGLPFAAALRLNEGPSPYESEDRIEGFRAFAEGREPHWQGR